MLPRALRRFYYWMAHQGRVGYGCVMVINWLIYHGIYMLRIPPPYDRKALVIVSHTYKFIYIGIPKVATRSFLHALITQGQAGSHAEYTENNAKYPQQIICRYPDYFVFSFVRNPWMRALSCYRSKIDNAVLGKQARILSFYPDLSPKMTFSDFTTWLCTQAGQDQYADRHWMSQHKFLYNAQNKPLCDYVGRMETLDDDLKIICDKIGCPAIKIEQRGFISRTHNDTDLFAPQDRERIAQRYAKDIQLFYSSASK